MIAKADCHAENASYNQFLFTRRLGCRPHVADACFLRKALAGCPVVRGSGLAMIFAIMLIDPTLLLEEWYYGKNIRTA